jgi:predicted RNase H-like nuclease (RuvC/YqgF family)
VDASETGSVHWRAVRAMARTWKLRKGKVLVVEDARTASLVIVARDLIDRNDKVAAVEEVLRKLQA